MARSRLLIEAGDTLRKVVNWQDSDEDPVDLTGYTVTVNITVGEIVYNLTSGSGLTIDAPNGKVTVVLSDTQTAAFTKQFGKWRLRAESTDNTTLAEGLVFISM